MPSTYSQLLYHIVFSTKHRRPQITADLEPRLHAYLGGIINEQNGVPIVINGTEDHVHLLIRFRPNGSLSNLLRNLKGASSGWVHDHFPNARDFAWQDGYAAFTVSKSALDDVKAYILNQKEHHRKRDFKDELLTLLRLHEVEYNERYVFD